MEIFTLIGLTLVIGAIIIGFTSVIGWITDDDDHCLKWLIVSLLYAVTLALFIVGGRV